MNSTLSLTIDRVVARPVVLKLPQPIVARIATITDWPLVLIDLRTKEGVVGRSYLEPYTVRTMKYLVAALEDLGDVLRGHALAPVDTFTVARKSLHFVGYQGMSMIAVSGVDMAAWDALGEAPRPYPAGTAGPAAATALIERDGRTWYEETLP